MVILLLLLCLFLHYLFFLLLFSLVWPWLLGLCLLLSPFELFFKLDAVEVIKPSTPEVVEDKGDDSEEEDVGKDVLADVGLG